MRPDDVEFIVSGPGGGTEEDLVQPEGFPRLRRARLPLVVAGAVALLALIVVTVVHSPSGTPSAAPRATVTVAPSSPATPSSPAPSRWSPAPDWVIPHVACPLGASCAVLFHTPGPVRAAVLAALPGASHLNTVTTTTHSDLPGSQLLVRTITGRVGIVRLSVRITVARPGDRASWNGAEDAVRTQVTAAQRVRGEFVSVRLTAPPGRGLNITAVRHLVADPRLIRLA